MGQKLKPKTKPLKNSSQKLSTAIESTVHSKHATNRLRKGDHTDFKDGRLTRTM